MSSSRAGPRTALDGGQVDDHGHVIIPMRGVPLDVLIHPECRHTLEPGGVLDQPVLPFGEDGGVPGDPRGSQPG